MQKKLLAAFDIEVSPNLAWVYGAYEVNVLHYEREFEILSFSYQDLATNTIHVKGRNDYDDATDEAITKDLWSLFNDYEILIGHNIKNFDIRTANTRFLYWRLTKPDHYRLIDTLKEYKKYFRDNKNSLDAICKKHGIGAKSDDTHHELWHSCLNGDENAWRLMKKYNKNDVIMARELYYLIRPWIDNHPNLNDFVEELACPNCQSTDVRSEGFRFVNGTKYRRLLCQSCGARPKQIIKKNGAHGKIK